MRRSITSKLQAKLRSAVDTLFVNETMVAHTPAARGRSMPVLPSVPLPPRT